MDKFYPLIGPQAGGTKITLTGDNLMMNPMTILNIITSKNDSLQINKLVKLHDVILFRI